MNAAKPAPASAQAFHTIMDVSRSAFRWWTTELASLLPAGMQQAGGGSLIVTPIGSALQISRETAHGSEVLARFEDGDGGKWTGRSGREADSATLRLPPELAIRRPIVLAAAAAENLHEVVSFQLDRYTPFAADEVYLGCRVIDRDPDAEAITVTLAAALRTEVDALLARAAERGVACNKIVVEGDGLMDELPLSYGADDPMPPTHQWHRALWLAAALLLIADAALPLGRGHATLAALQQQMTSAKKQAELVATLRTEVEHAAEQAAIPVQRAHQTTLSAMLNELTHSIPDAAWVTQMQIDGGTLQLTGFAASANALIPLLEQSPLLTNAAFRSPVTQDPVHGVEQFQISVDLRRRSE